MEMGEDRIERAHHQRERDRQRYMRLRNLVLKKASQAKSQNLRTIPAIIRHQEEVKNSRKRKFTQDKAAEREVSKRHCKLETRANATNAIRAEDRVATVPPREKLKQEMIGRQNH